MKTYTIEASQTVIYQVKVKAKNKEEATEMFFSGEVDFGYNDIVDSGEIQIDSIKE